MSLADSIGWMATAVFTASYFMGGPAMLRRVQMGGASLWLSYGLVTKAPPVIVANLLVLGAACWAEYRHRQTGVGQAQREPSTDPHPSTSRAEAA